MKRGTGLRLFRSAPLAQILDGQGDHQFRKRWVAPTGFLDNECLEIDNTSAERVMRWVALARQTGY
nr:transposase [Sphingopyxis sp. Geo48]